MGITKMELYHIGHHCSLPECNKLDYLPFKCEKCSLKFCEDHWLVDQHSCVGKKEEDKSQPKTIKPKNKNRKKKNVCCLDGCEGHNLVPMLCNDCGLNFCVKHRFKDEHDCRGFTCRRSRLLAVY